MNAIRLRTEYLKNPLGIDIKHPRLMWNCEGGTKQTAYQIVTENWDSGKVASSSMWAEYPKGLHDRERVCWKIRLWDENDEPGPWNEAFFERGISTWEAKWITGNYTVNKKTRYPVDCLMIPEYLLYKLCGVKSHEYTNATTGGMVSAETGEYDPAIIDALGLPKRLFPKLQSPGAVIGEYEGIRVVLCATHDTASAVEGIPMEENTPYLSSGTWSLLGVKTERPITTEASEAANWSNEGGVGYNRYQKNIMGMWLVNRLRSELCPNKPWPEIVAAAEASSFDETVDANDGSFLSPKSMRDAFDRALGGRADTDDTAHFSVTIMPPELLVELFPPRRNLVIADYFRCAYRSLALSYRNALDELERNTGKTYDKLCIVGGGAKNQFLNRLTEEAAGKTVIALPIEATAIGNLNIQIKASPRGEAVERSETDEVEQ